MDELLAEHMERFIKNFVGRKVRIEWLNPEADWLQDYTIINIFLINNEVWIHGRALCDDYEQLFRLSEVHWFDIIHEE